MLVAACVFGYSRIPSKGHPANFTPADSTLRESWLYYYASRSPGTPRAFMFFLGNDIAFWGPHQDLAWRLSGEGLDVVGLDVRQFLETLPSQEPQRDSAFGAAIGPLIARTRHAMSADSLPLILAGHSFGAEVAFWTAEHHPPQRLIGVLSLNTRATGHLFITPADWLTSEPSGAWSFSVVESARHIDPRVRIALVRGHADPYGGHDSAFVADGGARLHYYRIPLAGHSLKSLIVAGPYISRAVNFLTDNTQH